MEKCFGFFAISVCEFSQHTQSGTQRRIAGVLRKKQKIHEDAFSPNQSAMHVGNSIERYALRGKTFSRDRIGGMSNKLIHLLLNVVNVFIIQEPVDFFEKAAVRQISRLSGL